MRSRLRALALSAIRDELVQLVDAVAASVVTVRNTTSALEDGTGSGWLVQPGVVVTNHHVVTGDAPDFHVRLRGGVVVHAELIGSDEQTELALLRCETGGAPPLALAQQPPPLGELCFAFGSPLGEFTESVTFGIVSGRNRRLPLPDGRSIERVLQTDAEINPGNSGGPLVNLGGEVIGINVAIVRDGRGIGFAVPATTAATVIPELLEHGSVLRPRLGVKIDVVRPAGGGFEEERLRVSAAPDDHVLRPGDLLLAIADRQITCRADLFDVLRRPLADRPVKLTVDRQGKPVTLQAVLKSDA